MPSRAQCRTRRRTRAVTVALGMAFGLATSPAGHAAETEPGAPGVQSAHSHQSRPRATWTSKDAAAFWTPRRMAHAAPPARGTAAAAASSQRAPTAEHFDGIPSVGVLFSVDGDAREHHCTASVVHSPHGNLLLTAGHCNPGARAAFVPQYQSGEDGQPYGVWAIEDTYAYSDRATDGNGADLDFAFATVAPDDSGRHIEEVTGANVLTKTPGYRNQVSVIGYPSVHSDPEDRAVRCATTTRRLAGTRQLQMECNGFYGGTSGSPWIAGYNPRTHTGRVIGVIGGVNGGGPRGPHSDRTSYSPYFGKEILSLYDRASKARGREEEDDY
ncbi:trypsin-like serine peptidase [Streptomyces sp. NPDC057743]|uniref:trypsin-like serine peptidase n=1 Tax=Streptomyces sp. NPDC057743 TaxID=3346236 RepID=UPI003694B4D9